MASATEWLASSGRWITAGNFVSELGVGISTTMPLGMAGEVAGASRLLECSKAGHALRATVGSVAPPQPLPTDCIEADSVVRLGALTHDELLRGSADDRALEELVAALRPFSEGRFAEIVSVSPELWNATVVEATERLRRNVDRRLNRDTAESLLRAGFVLRALEEAFSLPPSDGPTG